MSSVIDVEQDSQVERAKAAYKNRFGSPAQFVVRAPGRVNLIGEHTDYNEGFVFPTAIDREIIIAAGPRNDGQVTVLSLDYAEEDEFALQSISKGKYKLWSNYLKGVLDVLQGLDHQLRGFDAVLCGNVPRGAGLSSSAAFEVAVATLCSHMNDLKISAKDIALIAQRAENEFVGVKCGIMDQYVSALGVEDAAILVDCRSLEFRAVPLNLAARSCAIVITNSGVQRGLVDSQYNARREQCNRGVEHLSRLSGEKFISLRDITPELFQSFEQQLDSTVARRCRHVVAENKRVLDAVGCLEAGDLNAFGLLMNASHQSLKDDFEVSCPELDVLVDLSQNHHGVIGSRMTGGGFGGCSVTLVQTDALQSYSDNVISEYEKKTRKSASVYVCRSTAGACVL